MPKSKPFLAHALPTRIFLILLTLIPALTLISAFLPGNVQGQPVSRRILIHGEVMRPFPALLRLDYPLVRAEAWLQALSAGIGYLPKTIPRDLETIGLTGELACLAVCALAFPVDVVTPEQRYSKSIRVFLSYPEDLNLILTRILKNPWILAKEMAIIWETRQAAEFLRKHWPKSVSEETRHINLLEKNQLLLETLWQATPLLLQALNNEPASWVSNLTHKSESIAILLEFATEMEGLESAEKAVQMLLKEEASASDTELANLWNRLLVLGLYLRAKAHTQLNQPALAETDLNSAITRLNKARIKDQIAIDIILDHAEIRKARKDIAGMCRDYGTACALGNCGELTIARQSGQCLDKP